MQVENVKALLNNINPSYCKESVVWLTSNDIVFIKGLFPSYILNNYLVNMFKYDNDLNRLCKHLFE